MMLGLAHLTAIDLPPADLVRAARQHGFDAVGLRLAPASPGGPAYPLPAGSAAAAAFRHVAADEGVRVTDIEFVSLTPDTDVPALEPLLAAGAALGAQSVIVAGDDPDPSRLAARFAALCALAQGFGLRADLEFMRFRTTATLEMALAALAAAGHGNGAVLLDTLHFCRTGGQVPALAALPAGLVRAVQISDAPAAHPGTTAALMHEARTDRLAPGDGALPLAAILRAFPDAAISVEAPNDRLSLADRLQRAHDGARRIITFARGA